jgi:hypothetical protein
MFYHMERQVDTIFEYANGNKCFSPSYTVRWLCLPWLAVSDLCRLEATRRCVFRNWLYLYYSPHFAAVDVAPALSHLLDVEVHLDK